MPKVLNNQLQKYLQNPDDTLSEGNLRKIRILFNMLKAAVQTNVNDGKNKSNGTNKTQNDKVDAVNGKNVQDKKKEKTVSGEKVEEKETVKDVKKKGSKRYVVFVGNLPKDVNKEKVNMHILFIF